MKRNSAHSSNQPTSPQSQGAQGAPEPQKPLSGPTDGVAPEKAKITELLDGEDWNFELEQQDPVWDLLDKASTQEPGPFFARNILRETRLQEHETPSWTSRLAAFFTPTRLTLGAAACACALVAYQMWPVSDPNTTSPHGEITSNPTAEPSSSLTEHIIEENLDAAAEDPTLFTRDEVVAMIGL